MFITLEGIEGCGKTTQIDAVGRWLTAAGFECVTTREPGGTPLGRRIRSVLLDPGSLDLVPMAELLLYTADRVQHLETVVRPALADGKAVVCDRYVDATLAYQGAARGLGMETVRTLHELACQALMPDLTLLLDLSPKIGLARAWRRIHADGDGGRESRFEAEQLDFHHRVRRGYRELARRDPRRFHTVDAAVDPTAVWVQIEAVLAQQVTPPGPRR